jgi:putative transposase
VVFDKVRTSIILTWMKTHHTKLVTYKRAYHFVWCPKYRKGILIGKIAAFVDEEIRRLCAADGWIIGTLNVQEDHVHLFLSTPPAIAPAHILKGATARKVFQHFPAREETTVGRRVVVSFVVCWECWRYELGNHAQIE